ncbi:MAG: hypothetical protein J1F09_04240 [Oscillospiraceae bacterium]|nr:hypothetical protein [Oscillospiraceae bacterium]
MKKLISLALISAMLLTFTACDKKENSSDTSTENSQSNQTSNSESTSTSSEPVSTPGSGWTYETAAGVFCLDGKPIPNPFTIDALGSDYSIKKSDTKIEDGLCSTYLYHGKDKILYLVYYYNINKFDEVPSAKPSGITVLYEEDGKQNEAARQLVSFNGIKFGATKDEVLAAFGEPYGDVGDSVWAYTDAGTGRGCIGFVFSEDGKVKTMILNFKD